MKSVHENVTRLIAIWKWFNIHLMTRVYTMRFEIPYLRKSAVLEYWKRKDLWFIKLSPGFKLNELLIGIFFKTLGGEEIENDSFFLLFKLYFCHFHGLLTQLKSKFLGCQLLKMTNYSSRKIAFKKGWHHCKKVIVVKWNFKCSEKNVYCACWSSIILLTRF